MIKPFEIKHLGAFMPNEFSNPDFVLPLLVHPQFEVKSMIDETENVLAIIAYQNYWGTCWQGFLLIAQRFPFPAARTLRKLLHATMAEKGATRFQTESASATCLRAWHEYLGFKHEGTRKKMMFHRDYDLWALMREGA